MNFSVFFLKFGSLAPIFIGSWTLVQILGAHLVERASSRRGVFL